VLQLEGDRHECDVQLRKLFEIYSVLLYTRNMAASNVMNYADMWLHGMHQHLHSHSFIHCSTLDFSVNSKDLLNSLLSGHISN